MRKLAPVLLLLSFAPSCRCASEAPHASPASSAAPSAVARPEAPPSPFTAPLGSHGPQPQRAPRNWALPSGPVLAILAGQGVGPIRIGATVATIERHMAAPCDVKTKDVCRYLARAVEFQLENGVTKTIVVSRAGRPAGIDAAGKDAEYGFFNGAIPPDLQLGMVPTAIQEHLGPPKRVERSQSAGAGAADRVEIHHYDGMRIEYDRIENGNLVVGGIILFKESAPTPATSAPSPLSK
jgi:hypothetical protein